MEVNSLKINERIAALENMKMQILWENPNPNQDFPTQVVTLSSSDYDFLDFYFARSLDITGRSFRLQCRLIRGFNGMMSSIFGDQSGSQIEMRIREIGWVSYSQFRFGNGLVKQVGETTATTRNDILIPEIIVGVKGF